MLYLEMVISTNIEFEFPNSLFYFHQSYGTVPRREDLQKVDNVCPICQDKLSDPVKLSCSVCIIYSYLYIYKTFTNNLFLYVASCKSL